ncbi:hypothetical protein CEE37_01250 [candidate division LCP-89 bacterium B3_LCP]|uniref:Glycosyltransferase 2-like domain-containing protein n=1 Tax=candidate division LCP-89 bacterium B3_LCP TaxID=2012998 RepID=A0A532V557_UNCL8|nr:MAG: hypothetical protein CEE37_01250 [candidate division LCP-89 bacterium B3_LCP]
MVNQMLEPLWTVLLAATGLIYFAFLEVVRRGLGKLRDAEAYRDKADEYLDVSVIIPCRNEAEHIGHALNDLIEQNYPADKMQIIVVNDRSTDDTGKEVSDYLSRMPQLELVEINLCPDGISPKQNALVAGMQKATGDIIITTDGDCRFQKGWVSALVNQFKGETGVVTGLTVFDRGRSEPFWQRMQQLDYLSHSFFAAGAIGAGMAFNCNGSNLALRREVFDEVGGYGDLKDVSVSDDTALLQRIKRDTKWDIAFSTDPQNRVHSWPEETPAEVFNQRLRWAAGGVSSNPRVLMFELITFIFFMALFLSPWLWLGGLISGSWVVLFILKLLQELRVMRLGWNIFKIKPDMISFLAMELVHIPAILLFSILGNLWGFRWKGQHYKGIGKKEDAPSMVSER